jgi:hypothetical protein
VVDIGQDNGSKVVALEGSVGQIKASILGGRINSSLAESVIDVRLDLDLGRGGDNGASSGGLILRVTEFVAKKSG